MKKIVSIVLINIIVVTILFSGSFSLNANAATATSGTTGSCKWKLDGTVLTISGRGSMGSHLWSGRPWGTDITEIIIEEGVTSIGQCAFFGCSKVVKVTIPSTVRRIESQAFESCYRVSVYINSLRDFCNIQYDTLNPHHCAPLITGTGDLYLNGSLITDLVIPEGVTTIGASAFDGARNITSVKIPASVSKIGENAFSCPNLKKTYISDLKKWCNIKFDSYVGNPLYNGSTLYLDESLITDLVIPEGVTTIEDYAFSGLNVASVKLSSSVKTVGEKVFYNCDMKSVEIPSSVTSIGADAFDSCDNLDEVHISDLAKWCNITFENQCANPLSDSYRNPNRKLYLNGSLITGLVIPEGVTTIGAYTFPEARGITSVNIPTSVKTIGKGAFYDCDNLDKVYISDLAKWCNITFENLYANPLYRSGDLYLNGNLITDLVIPEGVTAIGAYAFDDADSITSVQIPSSVINIGPYAFDCCSQLQKIDMPKSIINIGPYAFSSCKNLSDIWYQGSENDREEMEIDSSNSLLTGANWRYNTCEKHLYKFGCDLSCENCEWNRSVEIHGNLKHNFIINDGCTCDECGYSKKATIPELQSKISGTITLVNKVGMEYSINGETWQDSNVFGGLSSEATYIVYQRVKESFIAQVSEPSEGLVVVLKSFQSKPSAPTVSSYTDKTVTLIPLAGVEYSLDGVTWQASNVFGDLSSGTKYTFYHRHVETDTHEASGSSIGTSVTTDKSKQTLIPNAPVVQSVSAGSITLVPVEGCEYSKNGTTWQSSNVFSNLSCGTEYTFYQRYKETSSTYVGKSSEGTIGKTDKGTQSAPSRPSLSKKTHNSVTLVEISGYEYSMDGVNWQKSNIFTELNPETNYLFYQRKAETETHYASAKSNELTVKTKEMYESISVSTLPNKISYLEGQDELDVTGGQISLCYPDGTTAVVDITADMVTGFNNKAVGKQTLTVSYEGFTATFTVEVVAKSVVSIAITTTPNKLTYMEGESFEQTGMVVMAYYNNGTSEEVTDYIISGYTSTPGSKTITVTYGGKTANFNVVVNAKPILGTWKYDGTGWWYQNANGTYPANCWKEIDNVWYYFNPSGYMLTGWQSIGGTWYYFNGRGAMLTGWQSIGGTWYYFNGSGAMTTGWQSISGVWYYFEGSGAMVANRWIGNYYLQGDGSMATNKWIGSYYVGSDGVWVP